MVDRAMHSGAEPVESLRSSMRETMHEGVALLNAEMRLLVEETSSNLRSQIMASVAIVVAGVLGLVGLIFLATSAAWFLAIYLGNPGLAYLIVAVALILLASIIFFTARRRLSFDHLIPRRFLRSLSELRFDLREKRHG
jgi:hypothetical protein